MTHARVVPVSAHIWDASGRARPLESTHVGSACLCAIDQKKT